MIASPTSIIDAVPSSIMKRIPYVGPAIGVVGLTLDIKNVFDEATPVGAAKIILVRAADECLPPALFFSGKCLMLIGGAIAIYTTGGSSFAISGTLAAARLIVKSS